MRTKDCKQQIKHIELIENELTWNSGPVDVKARVHLTMVGSEDQLKRCLSADNDVSGIDAA